MANTKWAPDNDDGQHAYLVTISEFGGSRVRTEIEYADSLAEAKALYGYRQMAYENRSVRRAKATDVQAASA
jgi:hypothetical protein